MPFEFSGDAAITGGIVSSVIAYLGKLVIGKALHDIAEGQRMANARHEQMLTIIADIRSEVGYIKGVQARREEQRNAG